MNIKKMLSKRKMAVGLLVGLSLMWAQKLKAKKVLNRRMAIGLLQAVSVLVGTPDIAAREEENEGAIDARKNIIAIHDSSSKEYRKRCSECHTDIPVAESLDPSVPAVHVAMFPFAPGKPGDDKQCVWCHRTVDLSQGTQPEEKSKGNLRKHVDAQLCTLCHGPSGPAKEFYQGGLSPEEPDGPTLYELACAACHKDLENSKVRGATARRIQHAIDRDKGEMGPLAVLTEEEVQAIADALARVEEEGD